MNAIEAALYATLTADATLVGLLGEPTGVHADIAPEGAAMPCVVMQKLMAPRRWTFTREAFASNRYQLRATDRSSSRASVGAIDDRICALLNDAALAVAGHTLMVSRASDSAGWSEVKDGVTWRHASSDFEIWTTTS